MNKKKTKLTAYLEEQIAASEERRALLVADDRLDEGNFEKIRANIYDIFKTILAIADKTCGEDDAAMRRFFQQKLEEIPGNWNAAYERAKQHEDVEKMHIESIKLDVTREVKEMFAQIWEGNA